ncbi:MAG: HAMP domain-containing histidine kinase [Lachnospiraceae bacterium]|nr:HAMP domain-containing histidine kinase [Lachnospiraceae bacterium]
MKNRLKDVTFRTRLVVLSVAMVLVPVTLSVLAFLLIVKFINTTENIQISTVLATYDIAQIFMIDMVTCIIAILLITVIVMRRFMQRWFIDPLQELRFAMNEISKGNLDHELKTDYTAEMGELFANYEQMRLRLKESAEERLENERKHRELVSNISHDLKTPITSIRGYVEGIMDGVADTPEKMDKYIRTIYNKSKELSRLINELTLYSNIDQNMIPYNFRRISVDKFFRDCTDDLCVELESEGFNLSYFSEVSKDCEVVADSEQIRRVISNIISNSIKYRRGIGDRISIRLLDHGSSVIIEIEDNGRGISAEDLPHIFERFYRSDTSRSSVTGGSGIGLSIVKKVIEDHGGNIWATGALGKGTCIHFELKKIQ